MSLIEPNTLMKSADVVIIGGGVIGLSIARELALRGVRKVTVIERGEFGQEASWAAGGILAPQVEADESDDFFRLACASRDLYPKFAAALAEETAIDVEFDTTGTLFAGFTENDEEDLRQRLAWQVQAGFSAELLSSAEARQLEPALSPLVRCALYFPHDWQVENRRLTQALIKANRKLGVELIGNCEAQSIQIETGQAAGVQSSIGCISTRTVVIAAGAWTSNISANSRDFVPAQIEPVRGQMLCFQPGPAFARHVLYSSRGYLVPRRDGRILAGSTSELAGFDKRVTDEGRDAIKSMATEIAPALETAAITESWAGFRPHSQDDLPVLGPAGDVEGLFYATGHYRNGILLAPITGQIVADAILGTNSSRWLQVFSPDRFRLAATGR